MMRRTIYTCYSLLLATVLLPGTISVYQSLWDC